MVIYRLKQGLVPKTVSIIPFDLIRHDIRNHLETMLGAVQQQIRPEEITGPCGEQRRCREQNDQEELAMAGEVDGNHIDKHREGVVGINRFYKLM